MSSSEELIDALFKLENCFQGGLKGVDKDEVKEEIGKLRLLYQECKEQRVSEDNPTPPSKSSSERSKSTRNSLDPKTKVKFLLRKCKELYDLIQKYDTPTEDLARRAEHMKRKISKAVRPHQEMMRDLFKDGVLEDISTVFIKLMDPSSHLPVGDPKEALAYYLLKNDIIKENEKSGHYTKKSSDSSKEGPPMMEGRNFETSCGVRMLREKINTDVAEEKSDYFYDEILDEDIIPRKVLQELYGYHDQRIADRTMRYIMKHNTASRAESKVNLVKEFCQDESETEEDWSLYDWSESDESQDLPPKKITEESLHEKKFSSFLRTYVIRLKKRAFPTINMDRWSVAKFKSRKIISSPVVKKLTISGKVRRFYSHPSHFYAKEKRLHGERTEPSAKAKARQELGASELTPTQRAGDSHLKTYIERVKRSRVQNMEHQDYVNKCSLSKGFYGGLQSTTSISVPFSNGDIVKERMEYWARASTKLSRISSK